MSVPNDSMRPLIKNVIIIKRLHVAPDQANRGFFGHTDCIFQLQALFYIYARATRMPPRDFDLRGQKWRHEVSRVGERKGVFIHVVYENYSYDNLDVFVVIDVVIIKCP